MPGAKIPKYPVAWYRVSVGPEPMYSIYHNVCPANRKYMLSDIVAFHKIVPRFYGYSLKCALILKTRVAGRLRMSDTPVSRAMESRWAAIASLEGAIKVNHTL